LCLRPWVLTRGCAHLRIPAQVRSEFVRQAVEEGASYDQLMRSKDNTDHLTDEELLEVPFEALYKTVRTEACTLLLMCSWHAPTCICC